MKRRAAYCLGQDDEYVGSDKHFMRFPCRLYLAIVCPTREHFAFIHLISKSQRKSGARPVGQHHMVRQSNPPRFTSPTTADRFSSEQCILVVWAFMIRWRIPEYHTCDATDDYRNQSMFPWESPSTNCSVAVVGVRNRSLLACHINIQTIGSPFALYTILDIQYSHVLFNLPWIFGISIGFPNTFMWSTQYSTFYENVSILYRNS